MRCRSALAKRNFCRRGPPRGALRDHAAEEALGRDADPGARAAAPDALPSAAVWLIETSGSLPPYLLQQTKRIQAFGSERL